LIPYGGLRLDDYNIRMSGRGKGGKSLDSGGPKLKKLSPEWITSIENKLWSELRIGIMDKGWNFSSFFVK
jgi:hypothetical protein